MVATISGGKWLGLAHPPSASSPRPTNDASSGDEFNSSELNLPLTYA